VFRLTSVNERDLRATQRGTDGELTIGEGNLLSFIVFNTIVGVREPNYGDVCLFMLHAGFQEKIMFLTNEMRYVYY